MNENGCNSASSEEQDRIDLLENISRIKHKIIVLSGKGGVGKSTVAVNLAFSLAEKKLKTGLLDVDIHGPSIPTMLGMEPAVSEASRGERFYPVEFNNYLKVLSVGFFLQNQDDAVIWRGPLKYSLIKQFLKDSEWGELDYLIIDSPPGTGDEPLSVCQMIENPDGAVVVTTPQDTALVDVRKSVTFCNLLKMPVLGVIENMSGFICPHCGKDTPIFKTGGGETMAADMNIPFLGRIPIEPMIVKSSDEGNPYFNSKSVKSIAGNNFSEIVDKIIKGVRK